MAMVVPEGAWRASVVERAIALAMVLLLHSIAIFAFRQISVHPLQAKAPEMMTMVVSIGAPREVAAADMPIQLAPVAVASISAPAIEIETSGNGSLTADQTSDLPPRPDPSWVNAPAALPASMGAEMGGIPALIVVVRALVLETGKVAQTEIAASSGFAHADAFAMEQVRTQWRFLPAVSSGKPVRDWVTVQVLLKAA